MVDGKRKVELLAPARDLEVGRVAIDAGADAVYIGAPMYGARQAAGNSIDDIRQLCEYAHLFSARVLVTLNTCLTDDELPRAVDLAWQLYEAGADGLIIQDMGLLQHPLPPLRIHASTQCDSRTVEKVRWLEQVGFQRVVLARELNIQEIREIRRQTTVELEAFVHGALCVSYSGQCYMSQAICRRSANKGACAQMCRQRYDLVDADGHTIVKDKYLLSLKDLDRSEYLLDLLDAGVTTLKIEGRLKDAHYVRNIVAYYRQRLDVLFSEQTSPYCRASEGEVTIDFQPDTEKTFHRGATSYLFPPAEPLANWQTPASTGEMLGIINSQNHRTITIKTEAMLTNGDGLSVADMGFSVNGVDPLSSSLCRVVLNAEPKHSIVGERVYRNYDKQFHDILEHSKTTRRLPVDICFRDTEEGFELQVNDVVCSFRANKQVARNADKAIETIRQQLQKLGDTCFVVRKLEISLSEPYFIPIAELNRYRRETIQRLMDECFRLSTFDFRRTNDSLLASATPRFSHPPLPTTQATDYRLNITNRWAREFYKQCGVQDMQSAFEVEPTDEAELMRCRYCLLLQLGRCRRKKRLQHPSLLMTADADLRQHEKWIEPLYLRQGNRVFRLHFDCSRCEMYITK